MEREKSCCVLSFVLIDRIDGEIQSVRTNRSLELREMSVSRSDCKGKFMRRKPCPHPPHSVSRQKPLDDDLSMSIFAVVRLLSKRFLL